MEFKLHPRVSSSLVGQENLFSRFLEEIWGCHPISTFREGWKKDKERALLKKLHCHHSWMKVGSLLLCLPLLSLFMFVFASCVVGVLVVACMWIDLGRVSLCVVIFLWMHP